ncbi:unnamed protein product, partial [Rotaria magnacalcarata]
SFKREKKLLERSPPPPPNDGRPPAFLGSEHSYDL